MANRTRNIVLRVPVTAEERAMIERKMQQMGTSCFSVYARKMLMMLNGSKGSISGRGFRLVQAAASRMAK